MEPQPALMFVPSGSAATTARLGAKLTEHPRRHLEGRAVRAVQHHLHPSRLRPQTLEHELDVPLSGVTGSRVPSLSTLAERSLGVYRQSAVSNSLLGLRRQLAAFPGEELDAVVRVRVVRGADDPGRRRAELRRQSRYARCGENAEVYDVGAAAGYGPGGRAAQASIPPESRVSRPIRIGPPKARAAARPSRTAISGVRSLLATPRTPSVPKVISPFNETSSNARQDPLRLGKGPPSGIGLCYV